MLISVAVISYKYGFEVFCDWALDVLDAYSTAFPGNFISSCEFWPNVGRILRLAEQCQKESLVKTIEEEWLACIGSNASEEARLVAFEHALDIAETSEGLSRFHGKAYYAYLRAIGIFDARSQGSSNAVDIGSSPSYADRHLSQLDDGRKLRLYQGFWSLSHYRIELTQAPNITHDPSCLNHTRECVPAWRARWKKVLDDAQRAGRCLNDPGRLLEVMQEDLAASPIRVRSQGWLTIQCDRVIRGEVNLMKREFYDTIGKHFMIPQ